MQMQVGTDGAQSSFRRAPIMVSNIPTSTSKPMVSRNGVIGLNAMFQNIRVNTAPNGAGCGCGK